MNKIIRLLPISYDDLWKFRCGTCGTLMASGLIALIVAEDAKLTGLLVDSTVEHCGKSCSLPAVFDNGDQALIYTKLFFSGLTSQIWSQQQVLNIDSIGCEARRTVQAILDAKIAEDQRAKVSIEQV